LAVAALQAAWHFLLIKDRTRDGCFKAFRLNHWVGFAAFVGVLPSFAEDDYKLKKDYPTDARTLLKNMELATELARGAPNMETIVKSTRSEMNDFVAFYRRQPKVAGMPSFSTLYTAVNTLSGHYASYGNKYPVPEKRKVSRRARSLAWGVPAVCVARHSPPLLTLAISWPRACHEPAGEGAVRVGSDRARWRVASSMCRRGPMPARLVSNA
jgi:photosystem II Psb27 protein